MLGTSFTHDLIRKYLISFGTLFNDIKLMRQNTDDETVQWISVPLVYGAKEKWVNRLTDPNINQKIQTSLPRMSYELVTMNYAAERKINTLNKHVKALSGDKTQLRVMYERVPYDFQFALHLYTRNSRDATNIVEQILPFFTPQFTLTINDATEHLIDIDIPIRIDGITKDDAYEGDFESPRTIIWTIDFTLKGDLYGPTQNSAIIKKAYIDLFIPDSFVAFHVGTVAKDSATGAGVYLQANTSSRTSNTYLSGSITITGEGSGTTGITGNTRYIIAHDGNSQNIAVSVAFEDTPTDEWTYRIDYRTERQQGLAGDQLAGVPTASRIYTVPGLTGEGNPTTNAQLSVSESLIDGEDDFGFIQTRTFFPSNTALADDGAGTIIGTRRNLETGVDEDL